MPGRQLALDVDAATHHAREAARSSAAAIRAAIANPSAAGEPRTAHVLLARPRRALWLTTWSGLPGLMLDAGRRVYLHKLLPGWEYTPAEMRSEMLEDLERFADTGEQPEAATR